MLGQRVLVRLEDEAHLGAFERSGREVCALRGDGDVEALAVGQDAVARVEPERVRRAGLDGEGEVEHVAHRPERIFHLDVQRNHAVGVGLEFERGQIDGDAVEAAVHVLPAVGVAVAVVDQLRAEVGGDEDVHDGQAALSVFAAACRERRRAWPPWSCARQPESGRRYSSTSGFVEGLSCGD